MPDALPFEEVYRRYAGNVYKFCVSQLRDASAAEDVTSDVFVAALSAYSRVQPDADGVLSWLFRIAKNTMINRQRRRAVFSRALSKLGRERTEDIDTEKTVAIRADLKAALSDIQRLSQRDRELIGLRCAAGLSFAEIASIMNISEKAATMATYRAIEKVRVARDEAQ